MNESSSNIIRVNRMASVEQPYYRQLYKFKFCILMHRRKLFTLNNTKKSLSLWKKKILQKNVQLLLLGSGIFRRRRRSSKMVEGRNNNNIRRFKRAWKLCYLGKVMNITWTVRQHLIDSIWQWNYRNRNSKLLHNASYLHSCLNNCL